MMDKNSHLILTQKENISLSDISFLQAQANYTILFLYSGKQIVATKTLKAIGLLLPSNEFIRPHRSFIIRQDFIETINFKKEPLFWKIGQMWWLRGDG